VLEAIEKGTGRSEDLTNFAIAAASTAGVPCAAVYTPWWTRSDGNQAWSEAWVGGRWRSFAGCEPAPEGEFFDRIKEKPCFAKVYRKRFVAKEGEDETFGEDLTADYTPVAGLSLEVERAAAPVQLGVWNSNGWRAVAAAVSGADKKAVFKNVGCRETILFAAFFQDAEAGIAQPPFLFGPGGTVERLTTDLIEPGAAGLQGVKLEALLPNTAYGLAYFTDRQWLLVARGTAKIGGDLDFGVVGREKTLYVLGRIYGERTLPQGRPFLLEFEGGKAIMKKY